MTDDKHIDDGDPGEAGIERTLAESLRLERDERDAAIRRQLAADEKIVRALTKE